MAESIMMKFTMDGHEIPFTAITDVQAGEAAFKIIYYKLLTIKIYCMFI